jgi:hypothetical protein
MNAPTDITATRSQQIAGYAAGALTREFPAEVLAAAKLALIDVMGCAIGAWDEECVRPVRRVVEGWGARGNAQIFLGGRTAPAFAALVNGTMAHAMDYDDSHQMGAGHVSCVCGTAALALAGQLDSSEKDTLAAYITGFEVMARLAGGGPPGIRSCRCGCGGISVDAVDAAANRICNRCCRHHGRGAGRFVRHAFQAVSWRQGSDGRHPRCRIGARRFSFVDETAGTGKGLARCVYPRPQSRSSANGFQQLGIKAQRLQALRQLPCHACCDTNLAQAGIAGGR